MSGQRALRRVEDLLEDPKNARRHPGRNLEMITASLREVGAARSIVIDEHGVVLAGNGVQKAAPAAGIKNLRIIDTDGDEIIAVRRRGLSKDQKTKLALYDNRAGELSEWNPDVLRKLTGSDLSKLWTAAELADIIGGGSADGAGGRTDPDAVPAPRRTSIKAGQVFALGVHRLACIDATDGEAVAALLGGEKIDATVSSPPYNVGIKYRSHKDKGTREAYLQFITKAVQAFVPHMASGRFVAWNIGVSPKTFPAHQVVALENCGLTFYRQIVWEKSGVPYPVFPSTIRTKRVRHYAPNYTHEVIQLFETRDEGRVRLVACTLCDGSGKMAIRELPSDETHGTVQLMTWGPEAELGAENIPDRRYQNDVWHIAQSQSTVGIRTVGRERTRLKHGGKIGHAIKEHPAPFPVELPRAVLSFISGPNEVAYDPFGGSGSTLIAGEQLKRRARLGELDPVYCQIAIDRWEAFTGKKATKVGEVCAGASRRRRR